MVTNFGLSDAALALVRGVLESHPQVTQALIFGSRAMDTHRPESDVDIALLGNVDERLAAHIAEQLEELPLPYRFDVQAFSALQHTPLREHIERVGQPLFVRDGESKPG